MVVSEVAVYLFTKYPGMKSSTQYQDMGKSLVKAFPCLAFPGKRPWVGLLLFDGIDMNKRENAMHRITVVNMLNTNIHQKLVPFYFCLIIRSASEQ